MKRESPSFSVTHCNSRYFQIVCGNPGWFGAIRSNSRQFARSSVHLRGCTGTPCPTRHMPTFAARPALARPSPAQPSAGQPSPAQNRSGQPSLGQPTPAQASPGQGRQAQAGSAQPRPVRASPGQPRPAQASPGQPSPGQASFHEAKLLRL